MALYLSSGYLNQHWIQQQADINGISFIVEIGGRQVGKTYGTLNLMLEEKRKFILMRRTQTETDFICNDINNPFTVFNRDISVKRDTKYTARISENLEDGSELLGSVMALSTIAKIRGFNGSSYTDLVFDEFIPENHVIKIRDEGDAFLNALVTISGNREIEGKVPLRVWLLANANTIASPILSALNIQSKVEQMMNAGQEVSIMADRGIMIILPHSDDIMRKRKQTALIRAIKGDSKFTEMAFDNKFSYNDASNIMSVNLQEYAPVFALIGRYTVYKHKSRPICYVSNYRRCHNNINGTDRELTDIKHKYPNLRSLYYNGCIYFANLVVKESFVDTVI